MRERRENYQNWSTLRGLIFAEIYFPENRFLLDQFLCGYILADRNFGIFLVVKISRILKFQEFCLDFIFMVAEYVFLTCTALVVDTERFAVILTRLKSINQSDAQFTLSNGRQNLSLLKLKPPITNSTKALNGFIFMDRKMKEISHIKVFVDLLINRKTAKN